MTNLTVVFRNFVNAPKKRPTSYATTFWCNQTTTILVSLNSNSTVSGVKYTNEHKGLNMIFELGVRCNHFCASNTEMLLGATSLA